ncbi:MAG: cyanase [Thermaerobacter sp.]|nr:cyanase [Thermaerobacter sp.]
MTREEATLAILEAKRYHQKTWSQLAEAVGRSDVWTAAACYGQAPFAADEAERLAALLDLPAGIVAVLTEVPHRGGAMKAVPRDPTVYRLYEIVLVYGDAIKAIVHEKFGDGIMSAIDFRMDIARKPDPAGDRVVLTLDGKFLPYKKW